MVSIVSFHEMRSHWLVPRSPTRFMGYFMRLGLYRACTAAKPLAQMRPFDMGSMGSPSTLITRPSFTCTSTPQLEMQARQDEWTISTASSSVASSVPVADKSVCSMLEHPATAQAAAAAPATARKLRRVSVALLIGLFLLFPLSNLSRIANVRPRRGPFPSRPTPSHSTRARPPIRASP